MVLCSLRSEQAKYRKFREGLEFEKGNSVENPERVYIVHSFELERKIYFNFSFSFNFFFILKVY